MSIVSRRGRHYARVHIGGGKYSYGPTRASKSEAKSDHLEIELKKSRGQLARDRNETLAQFAERWPIDFNRKLKSGKDRWDKDSLKNNAYALKPLVARFGETSLRALSDSPEFSLWLVAQPECNRKVYRAMFANAVQTKVMPSNPAAGLGLEQSKGRSDLVVLNDEETELLAEVAHSHWKGSFGLTVQAIVVWQFTVGTRGIGLRNVRVDDLNAPANEVYVRHPGKGVKPRTIFVPTRALQAVAQMPRALNQEWLFTTKTGLQFNKASLYAAWDPVRRAFESRLDPRRASELRDSREDNGPLELHELRHCAATSMRRRGATWEQIGWQLCHSEKDAGFQARTLYSHLTEDDHMGAMRAVFSDQGTGAARDVEEAHG